MANMSKMKMIAGAAPKRKQNGKKGGKRASGNAEAVSCDTENQKNTQVSATKPAPAAGKTVTTVQKSKKADKSKVVFTRENINSHLLCCSEDPTSYKIMGLLTYLFKEFKDEPTELLAKIKVLTMKKKVEGSNEGLAKSIFGHVFAIFNMQGDFYENMFKLLQNKTFLAQIANEFYFKSPMAAECFAEHFNKICDELVRLWEDKSGLSYEGYAKNIERMSAYDSLADFVSAVDDVPQEEVAECADLKASKIQQLQGAEDPEESNFSLVSLEDDAVIERLDAELGQIFHKDEASEDTLHFSGLLIKSLELLIETNYVSDIGGLARLLYFSQFGQLLPQIKQAVKAYISKFGDRKQIFRIFQMAALENPAVYALYGIFTQYCEDSFDAESFIKVAISAGHEDLIERRIESKSFYAMYKPGLGEEYDAMFMSLVQKEGNLETLNELLARENTPEAEEIVRKAIARVERRQSKPRRSKKEKKDAARKRRRNEKMAEKENGHDAGDSEKNDPAESAKEPASKKGKTSRPATKTGMLDKVSSGESKETSAEPAAPQKKKSFADKIGSKIVEKKTKARKEFRMQNKREKRSITSEPKAEEKPAYKSSKKPTNKSNFKKFKKN